MEVRELLCLRTARVWIMPREALAAGWLPCLVSTANEAIEQYERRHPRVGIILFDHFGINENADRELESLLARTSSNMEWIGLVPPEMMAQPAVCDILAKYLYDYHTLPVDDSRLITSLGHAYGMASLRVAPPLHCGMMATGHGCMIGDSPAMRKVFHQLDKIASVDSSVILIGESGTGKELAARIIFQHSARRNRPFVAVNCGAIPTNLIQSELFGHEKGSFTGAFRRQIGHIEVASGGTLFLDEIGDGILGLLAQLPAITQKKYALDPAGFDQELGECNGDPRFSGARGHHQQDALLAFGNSFNCAIDCVDLVVTGRFPWIVILCVNVLLLGTDAFPFQIALPKFSGRRKFIHGQFAFKHAIAGGFVVKNKTIAITGKSKRHIEHGGVIQCLLDAVTDAVFVVFGFNNGQRQIGFQIQNVIGSAD